MYSRSHTGKLVDFVFVCIDGAEVRRVDGSGVRKVQKTDKRDYDGELVGRCILEISRGNQWTWYTHERKVM